MPVDTTISKIHLTYPFSFDPAEFDDRVQAIERARWTANGPTYAVWTPEAFPVDRDVQLAVAAYLNPPVGTRATAQRWRISAEALMETLGAGDANPSGTRWFLDARQRSMPFQLETAALALFHTGVGFLTLCVHPDEPDLDVWLDFLHEVRFPFWARHGRVRAERAGVPFFPEPAGGEEALRARRSVFAEAIRALVSTGAREGEGRWWREEFVGGQLLPYVMLLIDGVPEPDQSLVTYRLRNFFYSREGLIPSDHDLSDHHPALMPYARGAWFFFSLDGGGFVAYDAPPGFYRTTLPDHLARIYFLSFLLPLHQRFALGLLSEGVASGWSLAGHGDGEDDLAGLVQVFERINNRLLAFTARGYFTSVMHKENHHRSYRRWQETFLVHESYNEVHDEVREMYDYLLLRWTRRVEQLQQDLAQDEARREREAHERAAAADRRATRLERLVGTIGVVFGIPAVVATFLGINIVGHTASGAGISLRDALLLVGLPATVGVVLIALMFYMTSAGRAGSSETEASGRERGE